MPFNSTTTTVLKINPATDTATTFGVLAGSSKWIGAVLASNGFIYGIPQDSTSILKLLSPIKNNIRFCLNRNFNKF